MQFLINATALCIWSISYFPVETTVVMQYPNEEWSKDNQGGRDVGGSTDGIF
jgi:hypothetical protein